MTDLLYEEDVFAIQGAIFNVSREMGIGFLEAVYQECLQKEFARSAIPNHRHPELRLTYRGEPLQQTYCPDFICYDRIIVELKVVQLVTDAHRAQILNYLKATGLRLGLLVNFGCHPKAQIERFIL